MDGEKRRWGVHKPDCQCAVCKKIRAKASRETAEEPTTLPEPISRLTESQLEGAVAPQPEAAVAIPPPQVANVLASSLRVGDRFEYKGRLYQAGIKDGDMLLVLDLNQLHLGTQVLGINSVVKTIK